MSRVPLICFFVLGIMIFCCHQRSSAQDQTVTTTSTPAAAGLDLQAVTEIVKHSKNAADIEQQLNAPGSVNNLDINGDGNVDYIHVTEYGKGNMRGFSLTVMDSTGAEQEIATIEIEREYNSADVIVVGEPAYYGPGVCYTGVWVPADVALWVYLWHPHRFYYSPYAYGYYPAYYHPYHPVPYAAYNSHVTILVRSTVIHRMAIPKNYRSRSPYARHVAARSNQKARQRERERSNRTTRTRSSKQPRERERE
ncbi:MAG: hypothetical protein WBW71_11390 [Bacteroidota bacterium]